MMKINLLSLRLLCLVFVLAAEVSLAAIKQYPEWFIYPSRYQNVVTGYSYRGLPALTVAENMYAAYKKCYAVGTLEIFDMDGTRDLLKNSNYYYEFSRDSVEKIEGRLIESARFNVSVFSGDYIAAFSLDDTLQLTSPILRVEDLPRPAWVDKEHIEDANYYYGIGMYTSIGLENDAWQTAEEQAIFNILNKVSVNFHKINILYQDSWSEQGHTQEISVIELKFALQNITIVERFPDSQNKLFYVLARINKNDVIPLYGF